MVAFLIINLRLLVVLRNLLGVKLKLVSVSRNSRVPASVPKHPLNLHKPQKSESSQYSEVGTTTIYLCFYL